jgi:hypothetical protein
MTYFLLNVGKAGRIYVSLQFSRKKSELIFTGFVKVVILCGSNKISQVKAKNKVI